MTAEATPISGSITSLSSVVNLDEAFAAAGPKTISGTSEVLFPVFVAPFPLRITAVRLISTTGMVASDTNYWIAMLRRRRARLEVTPYSDLVLADAPTAYWRLDEAVAAPNALDSGSGNQPLAYSVTPPTLAQPSLVRRSSDTSATFVRASSTFASTSVDYGWDFSTNQVTIEALIKPTTLATGTTDRYTIFARPDVGFQPSLELGGGTGSSKGRLAMVTTGAFLCETPSFVILPGNVYHCVYRRSAWDGSTATEDMWVNGIKQTLTTISQKGFTNSVTGTFLGKRKTGGAPANQYYDGGLDDVAVYNTALSDARILAHADAGAVQTEVARKTMKTSGSGGEGVTAWQPWDFSGADFNTYPQIFEQGDMAMLGFFPFGTPAALTDCVIQVSYEAV